MKKLYFNLLVLIVIVFSGCSSIPIKSSSNPSQVFEYSYDKVYQATINAIYNLKLSGQKREQGYIEVIRERDPNLLTVSGGETIGIWIKTISENKTEVEINTVISCWGIIGQKDWGNQILFEISNELTKKPEDKPSTR